MLFVFQVRKGICEWLAWILRMKRPGKPVSRKNLMSNSKMREFELRERSSRSLLANVLDLDDDFRVNCNTPNFTGVKVDAHDSIHNFPGRTELKEIRNELKYLTDKIKKDEAANVACNDWKFAAMVIDRLCLWAFTLFTVISTFGILFSAPHVIT